MRAPLTSFRRPELLAVGFCIGMCLPSPASEWPLTVGHRRQLLFDERFVQQSTNVQ